MLRLSIHWLTRFTLWQRAPLLLSNPTNPVCCGSSPSRCMRRRRRSRQLSHQPSSNQTHDCLVILSIVKRYTATDIFPCHPVLAGGISWIRLNTSSNFGSGRYLSVFAIRICLLCYFFYYPNIAWQLVIKNMFNRNWFCTESAISQRGNLICTKHQVFEYSLEI